MQEVFEQVKWLVEVKSKNEQVIQSVTKKLAEDQTELAKAKQLGDELELLTFIMARFGHLIKEGCMDLERYKTEPRIAWMSDFDRRFGPMIKKEYDDLQRQIKNRGKELILKEEADRVESRLLVSICSRLEETGHAAFVPAVQEAYEHVRRIPVKR